MPYQNPIIRGMYPDPSACEVDGTYYLVNSSFEYFPGVPVWQSRDLVNWEQVGNALCTVEQLDLTGTPNSGGIFATTIRHHDGRFYLITTCATRGRGGFDNFFVTAEDAAGPWSARTHLAIEGIDPSLYWEDGHTYVQYAGRGEIFQVEIDEATGELLGEPRVITCGCGGRDAEGPHVFCRDGWYYLLLAEGGTREGHMATIMRSRDLWGPYEPSPYGYVLSNKDSGRLPIQCVGHVDLLQGPDDREYLIALGVRQVRHRSLMGRETLLVPAHWTDDGWLVAEDRHAEVRYEDAPAEQLPAASFSLDMDEGERVGAMPACVISPRADNRGCYRFVNGALEVRGNGHGLSDGDSAFWAVRQTELSYELCARFADVSCMGPADEAGIAVLVSDDHHLSAYLSWRDGRAVCVFRRQVADLLVEDVTVLPDDAALPTPHELCVRADGETCRFFLDGKELGSTLAKHVTVEVSGSANTGVVLGVFVAGSASARITSFSYTPMAEARA